MKLRKAVPGRRHPRKIATLFHALFQACQPSVATPSRTFYGLKAFWIVLSHNVSRRDAAEIARRMDGYPQQNVSSASRMDKSVRFRVPAGQS